MGLPDGGPHHYFLSASGIWNLLVRILSADFLKDAWKVMGKRNQNIQAGALCLHLKCIADVLQI
jgi:hypothetical protein